MMRSHNAGEPHGAVRLGPLEAQVMDVLWTHGASTVREVINTLGGTRAYTTIATIFKHLDRKGLVQASRSGRSVRYEARMSREQHTAALMQRALKASGDRTASILHFVDSMAGEDRALLHEYLRARDEQGSL